MEVILLIEPIRINTKNTAGAKVYPVVLSSKQHAKKPSTYRRLHDELDNLDTRYISLIELLEAVTKGQTFRNGIHAKPSELYHDYKLTDEEKTFLDKKASELTPAEQFKAERLMKQQKIVNELKENGLKDKNEFVETNLAVLDVDDVLGKVDPVEVMEQTGAIALYYTFSHHELSPINTSMNRYRLLFDLSETVKGSYTLKQVQEEIKDNILNKYPYLHQQLIENKETKKTKKHDIDNILKMFYGTNNGYEINENFQTYDVSKVLEEVEKENKFNQLTNKIEQLNAPRERTSKAEIMDIANFLGDMNDELNHDEWITLAIGLWNTAQFEKIDDDLIVEALQILDGNRNNKRYYLDKKRPLNNNRSQATIGTLFKIATDRGYKRTHQQQPSQEAEQAPQIATRTHKIEKYIDKASMYELIANDDKRILVHADTNTGKTRASIEASQKYLEENKESFIYIALPTKPLSEQAVKSYNLNQALLGNMNVDKAVKESIRNGSRLLVGTYDKTRIIDDLIKDYELIIIADEAHKEVLDYFRYEAIQGLFDATVSKFIGLTGTPSEIDLSGYDSLEKFELGQPKVLADKLQFINYSNANGYEKLVSQSIELEVKRNNHKVLAFINNKKIIKKIAQALKKQGVKVATITADNRKSSTYTSILEEQRFDDVEVVLTTIVLADGININNTKDYVCMIAPSHFKGAPMFNIDTIRQATNRFRNQYKKIMIPFYINKDLLEVNQKEEPRSSDYINGLNYRYEAFMRSAEISKAYLQLEFDDNIEHFKPSIAEQIAGIFRPKEADKFNFEMAYKNKRLAQQKLPHDEKLQEQLEQLESKIWDIDKRALRSLASDDRNISYSLHPHAFKKDLKKALTVLETENIEASEYLVNMKADYDIAKVIDELTKLHLESERDKRDNVKKIVHELVYTKLQQQALKAGRVDESLELWQVLKKKTASYHYKPLTRLVKFMTYDEAIKELTYIRKPAQMYELTNGFKHINELESYHRTKSMTITESIVNTIKNSTIDKVYHTKKEVNEHVEQLAKDFKIKKRYTIAKKQKLFSNVFKDFFTVDNEKQTSINGKSVRLTNYKIIELSDLADNRNLSNEQIESLYKKYLYSR